MKKFIFFMAALGLMASCGSDLTDDLQSSESVPTVKYVVDDFVQDAPVMRSALSSNGKFTWSEGDAIGVIPDGSY